MANAEDDDVSLILRMADKDSDWAGAEAALVIFFDRHHRLLKGFAEKNNYRSLGFDPENFVLQTFHKAFEKAGTFDAPADLSPEQLQRKVRSWLFEIAKNEFLMEFRKGLNKSEETRDPSLLLPPEPLDQDETDAGKPTLNENQAQSPLTQMPHFGEDGEEPVLTGKAAAVRTFLDGLPEGDSQLLVTSMNFYDYKAKRVVIPKDILQGLANALATTPEGIKQKRKRLLQKLKEYLEKA
jgi:DNA-directed RNA polymerase specialized sigma24 family protein